MLTTPPAPPAIAAPEGKWGITYDYINNCTVDSCLTTMYWNWGPIYKILIEQSMNGTFAGEAVYFDADADGLGLYGFMEGQELMPGARDLPEEDLQLVRDELAAFLSGKRLVSTSSPVLSPIIRATSSLPKVNNSARSILTALRRQKVLFVRTESVCIGGMKTLPPSCPISKHIKE